MKDRKSGSRPSDPYRREAPVIDLPKGEFTSSAPAGSEPTPAATEDTPDAQTAIEPVAATGLDGPPPKTEPASAADAVTAVTPTPDGEIPTDAPPSPAADAAAPAESAADPMATVAEPMPPPQARERAAESGGFGRYVAAGIVGGVIGAGFAVGADIYWRQPPADFEGRLAALETRPRPAAPVPTVAQPANEAMERRLAALENQSRGLTEAAEAARNAAETSRRQLAELANRPAQAASAPATPSAPPRPDPAIREGLDRLGARIDGLEGRIAQAAPASALDELRTTLQTVQREAEERNRSVTAALGAVQAATNGVNQRLQASGEDIAKLTAEVAKLPPALLQAGLRTVVAGQIGQDLRSGRPLGPGLSALQRLGVAGPALEPLRPYAAQPAPDAATLAAEFKPLAATITAEPQGPAGSLTDRLLRVADKIVTVRAIGDGSGRDVPGLVGRIEAALARGALPEAAAAWDSLPDEPKRASAAWGTRLKARIAADNAAQKLGADSLAALDAPSR
jgi:hypothetical protein